MDTSFSHLLYHMICAKDLAMETVSSSLSARKLVVLQTDSTLMEEVLKATCEVQEVPREHKLFERENNPYLYMLSLFSIKV